MPSSSPCPFYLTKKMQLICGSQVLDQGMWLLKSQTKCLRPGMYWSSSPPVWLAYIEPKRSLFHNTTRIAAKREHMFLWIWSACLEHSLIMAWTVTLVVIHFSCVFHLVLFCDLDNVRFLPGCGHRCAVHYGISGRLSVLPIF